MSHHQGHKHLEDPALCEGCRELIVESSVSELKYSLYQAMPDQVLELQALLLEARWQFEASHEPVRGQEGFQELD